MQNRYASWSPHLSLTSPHYRPQECSRSQLVAGSNLSMDGLDEHQVILHIGMKLLKKTPLCSNLKSSNNNKGPLLKPAQGVAS